MDLGLKGRVIIVAGIGGPVADATAGAFVAEGATVVLATSSVTSAIDLPPGGSSAGRLVVHTADWLDPHAARDTIERTLDQHGSVYAVVAVWDICDRGSMRDLDDAAWNGAWSAVTGTAAGYRAVVPHMKARGEGRLVYIGPTVAKQVASAGRDLEHVVALGLLGLHKTLAGELGPSGITVNAVLHSGDAGHATVGDVAAVVAYLASVPAGFVTGVAVTADGGATPTMF